MLNNQQELYVTRMFLTKFKIEIREKFTYFGLLDPCFLPFKKSFTEDKKTRVVIIHYMRLCFGGGGGLYFNSF